MKKVCLTNRPPFSLLRLEDAPSSFRYMQMPTWLFGDMRFQGISLEAKVVYTFLLHRFRLSKMNGWTNEQGEVFVIYPREALAQDAGISYRKVIACFRELLAADLIWEQRCGRGLANHIYFAVMSSESKEIGHTALSNADQTESDNDCPAVISPTVEVPNQQFKTCKNGTFRNAITAVPEVPFLHANKKDIIKKDNSKNEKVSQSVNMRMPDCCFAYLDEEQTLSDILVKSELDVLPDAEASVFRNAVTRLFYSDRYPVGHSILPKQAIRSHLRLLDGGIILDTREKIRANKSKQIRNSTGYIMTCLINNICEYHSDIMVDPVLNSMQC